MNAVTRPDYHHGQELEEIRYREQLGLKSDSESDGSAGVDC